MMRKIIALETGELGGKCLWMVCGHPATHEVVNIAGETETTGCSFHCYAYRRQTDGEDGSRQRHPST